MNLNNTDEQTLISGFHDESAPENQRISCLSEIAVTNEVKAIELITEAMRKKPPITFMKSMLSLLPAMKCDQAHELMNYYLEYLLKPDAALLPKHTEMLASALPIMAEFHRHEYIDAIISAYTCFSIHEKQKAIIKSGVFDKLLTWDLSDQQKAEILLITGETEKIPQSVSREDFATACHKIIRKHADMNKIISDLEYVKSRGDMDLYNKIKEETKDKTLPDATRKIVLTGVGVLVASFILFYLIFIFHKSLTTVQVNNYITVFAIVAFSVIAGLGTLALFRYKSR